jgi:Ulp1 family protease
VFFAINRHDCGIFAMKYMEIWKPFLDLRTYFSDNDILNIRIQYAIKLYFLGENEAYLRVVTDFYSQ